MYDTTELLNPASMAVYDYLKTHDEFSALATCNRCLNGQFPLIGFILTGKSHHRDIQSTVNICEIHSAKEIPKQVQTKIIP